MDESVNVFNEPLESCSGEPLTGFFRDGCCNTSDEDLGSHTVCVQVTREFLEFSRFRGNDLSTPQPEFGFPGLAKDVTWHRLHFTAGLRGRFANSFLIWSRWRL